VSLPTYLSLPRRVWWPCDQPAERVRFEREFSAQCAAQAALFVSASVTLPAHVGALQKERFHPTRAPQKSVTTFSTLSRSTQNASGRRC
jgi:hypothetical protein